MKNQLTLRNAALAMGLAAITATAWAANESLAELADESTEAIATHARPVWTELERAEVTPREVPRVEDSLSSNESVVRPDDSVLSPTPPPDSQMAPVSISPSIASPAIAPAPQRSATQPQITIEEKRLTVDERIQADVMDRIASLQNVSGKIGVESHEAVVTLTGYTSTAGQASRVGREARSIIGVKSVENLIRPRIGGSV